MKLRKVKDNLYSFKCPGCGDWHVIDSTRWKVTDPDGNPSVVPSLLVTCGHFVTGHKPEEDGCWCKYNRENPDRPGPECYRCHSYITNGQIQFLSDCTHKLAGQTVPLPDLTDP